MATFNFYPIFFTLVEIVLETKVITSHRMPAPAPPNVLTSSMASTMAPSAPVFIDMSSSMVPTPTKRPVLQRQITKEDFDVDVSNIQAELDSFKDTLFGQINLDNAMVSSLFDAETENVPSLWVKQFLQWKIYIFKIF